MVGWRHRAKQYSDQGDSVQMSFREFYNFYDLEQDDEWHFTNDPAGYEVSVTTFDPKTISRGAIVQSGTTSKSQLDIMFPAADDFVQTIKARLDTSRITMSVWRQIFDRLEDDLAITKDTVIFLAINISGRAQFLAATPPIMILDILKPQFVNIAKHLATIARVRGININLGIGYYFYHNTPSYDTSNIPATPPFDSVNISLPGSEDFTTEEASIDTFFAGIPTPNPAPDLNSAMYSVAPMLRDYFSVNNLGADADNYSFMFDYERYNDTTTDSADLAAQQANYETVKADLQSLQRGYLTVDGARELNPITMSVVQIGGNAWEDKYSIYMRSEPRLFFPTHYLADLFDFSVAVADIYETVISPFLDIHRIWMGFLTGIEASDVNVKLKFDSGSSSERRFNPRRIIDVRCSHILYDSQCRALPNVFKIDLVFAPGSPRTGKVILCDDPGRIEDEGYLSLGYLEATEPDGSLFTTFIYYDTRGQTPSQIRTGSRIFYRKLTLARDIPPGATALKGYAGCNKQFKTCVEKFRNSAHYGGFPWMPTVSARDMLLGSFKPATEIT